MRPPGSGTHPKRSDAGDSLRLGAGARRAHARDRGASGDDVLELHAPREREHVPFALVGRLDLAALDEEELVGGDGRVLDDRADFGEGRRWAPEELAEDPQREL